VTPFAAEYVCECDCESDCDWEWERGSLCAGISAHEATPALACGMRAEFPATSAMLLLSRTPHAGNELAA